MDEIVLTESVSLRDKLCTEKNTICLQKIGSLVTLSQDGFATTEQVAEFYNVPLNTVKQIVKRHRNELDYDGYKVVARKEFSGIVNSNLHGQSRRAAIFPKKAILRTGMLLTESEVAKQVRHYLLNVEEKNIVISNQQTLMKMAEQLQTHAHKIVQNARQSSENAEQLVDKANIIKAIVQERYCNRHEIKKNRERIENLESQFSEWKQTDNTSPGKALTIDDKYITKQQIEALRKIVKNIPEKPIKVWRKFNKHFGISRYKFLPSNLFIEASSWLKDYKCETALLAI